MDSTRKVVIAQPGGLTLMLALDGSELSARLVGGGLNAAASAGLDRLALAGFFADAGTGEAPPWGRWEYKADDDAVVLHASPDAEGCLLLSIDLLASSQDESDWRVCGTLGVSLAAWRAAAGEVFMACGPNV